MKKILFTQRVAYIEDYNERRDCADQNISRFIYRCGFLPIPIPNDLDICSQMVERLKPDGLVMTGGNSLVKYGGDAPEKDKVDDYLIGKAIDDELPLLGFCRGMQSIVNYFGADLVQVSGHIAVRHDIEGSLKGFSVNSYHTQGLTEIPVDFPFKVLAKSKDGIIEAVKHEQKKILGLMWHPERETPFREIDIQLMQYLFG